MTYKPTVQKISLPKRGPSDSSQLNDFFDQVAEDIHSLSIEAASNTQSADDALKISRDEMRFLHRRIRQLEQASDFKKLTDATNGLRITYHQSMYKVDNLSFLSQNLAYRPTVSSSFGIMHLPSNAAESKFFSTAVYDSDIIVPSSLDVRVNSTFTPSGSSVPVDFEDGAINVIEGNPRNAFNGNNTSYWMREVQFPASSDVTEVQVEVLVTIPSQQNVQSNVLTIHPYPLGGIDVMDISTSSDLTSSFTTLQSADAPTASAPTNNAGEMKYIFPPQAVNQVRVRLRTRNFIESDDKKIFRIGLQELGLFLIDFEKATAALTFDNWIAQADSSNISAVHKIDAPDGYRFNTVHSFSSSPDITLENDLNRHVLFRIYDGDPSTGAGQEIWNSNQTYPQNQPDSVGGLNLRGSVSSLYVVTSMRYVETSGGVSSPFYANTSPYLRSFSMEASVAPSS